MNNKLLLPFAATVTALLASGCVAYEHQYVHRYREPVVAPPPVVEPVAFQPVVVPTVEHVGSVTIVDTRYEEFPGHYHHYRTHHAPPPPPPHADRHNRHPPGSKHAGKPPARPSAAKPAPKPSTAPAKPAKPATTVVKRSASPAKPAAVAGRQKPASRVIERKETAPKASRKTGVVVRRSGQKAP